MSEYEAVYLFREFLSDAYQLIFGYIGLVYGFLVVSYLVADKLNHILTVTVVSLYTLISLFLIASIYNFRSDAADLYVFILQQKSSGVFVNLDWFGQTESLRSGTILQQVSIIGALFGSLVFFFVRRRQAHNVDD